MVHRIYAASLVVGKLDQVSRGLQIVDHRTGSPPSLVPGWDVVQ